jgi:hypothetical protein
MGNQSVGGACVKRMLAAGPDIGMVRVFTGSGRFTVCFGLIGFTINYTFSRMLLTSRLGMLVSALAPSGSHAEPNTQVTVDTVRDEAVEVHVGASLFSACLGRPTSQAVHVVVG